MNNYIELYGNRYYHLENDIQRPHVLDIQWINDQLYIKGKLCHREDGPAIECSDGNKEYFQYGRCHRIEYASGNKVFYKDGRFHREDGPAVEYFNGNMEYYQYGKPHRIGGPAVEHTNGYKEYWENGKLHREDGPAIEWFDGRIEYYLCNKYFETKEDWEHYRDHLMIFE